MCEKLHTYLAHVLEELVTAPAGEVPVIIVLFLQGISTCNRQEPRSKTHCSLDNQGTVAARAATQELAPAKLHLATVDASALCGDDVPVRLLVKVL